MRFMTDLIYFVFFGLLFGNIVSGIMIDTFAERRSKREEMTDDKKNKCYICGRGRGEVIICWYSSKKTTKNLTNTSRRNIFFGTTFTTFTASLKKTRLSILDWSTRSRFVWIRARMTKTTSSGFLLAEKKPILMSKKCWSSTSSCRPWTLTPANEWIVLWAVASPRGRRLNRAADLIKINSIINHINSS